MPTLKQVLLDGNQLSGSLPQSWGAAGSMPSLQVCKWVRDRVGTCAVF
jgi:hypothetical protein